MEIELFFGVHPKLNCLALDIVLPSRFLSLGAERPLPFAAFKHNNGKSRSTANSC